MNKQEALRCLLKFLFSLFLFMYIFKKMYGRIFTQIGYVIHFSVGESAQRKRDP